MNGNIGTTQLEKEIQLPDRINIAFEVHKSDFFNKIYQ